MSLGVGVGWTREEYELMGQDFSTRGKRLDEMIPALRALWQGGWVSWSGEHYQVPELMLEPHPPAPLPILCGGESEVALRRAARLCDGWIGTAYVLDEAVRRVDRLTALRRSTGAPTSRSTRAARTAGPTVGGGCTSGPRRPASPPSCGAVGLLEHRRGSARRSP